MEVFEIKKRGLERQASSASSRSGRDSKVGYILTMAGIVLFTSAFLVVFHFTRETQQLAKKIESLKSHGAERLERRRCEVPFCETKECISIAAGLMEYMNPEADPCTDFYEYACGGYRRSKAVPYAMDSYSLVKETEEELLIDIRKLMDKPSLDNEDLAIGKMRRFFKSCMNSSLRDELENRTLSFWLVDNDIVPDTFVLGHAIDFEQSVQWTKLISKLEEYQIHTVFEPHFTAAENSAPQKIEVDCLVPFLSPESYLNSTDDNQLFQLMIYKEAMDSALELLQLDRDSRREFVQDVLKIETDLARIIKSSTPNQYLTEDQKQQLRSIWLGVVGNAVQEMEIVSTCKYDMHDILTYLNQVSNKNMVKYVTWRMLMEIMQYLGSEFRGLHLHYLTKLPRFDYAFEHKWRESADSARSEFSLAVTKDLFNHGFLTRDVVDVVKADFVEMKRYIALLFSTIEGVDPDVATKFLDKLKDMKIETGYSELMNQEGILDSFYQNIEMNDDYFLNVINMKRFRTREYLTRLWYTNVGGTNSQLSLKQNPLGTTASYDYLTNTVYVDLGLFKPPLFRHSEEIPHHLKYAYYSVISREMTRAFDASGTFFDFAGNRFEKILWPSSMEQRYDNIVSCIKEQLPGLNTNDIIEINDTRILNNFIADLGAFYVPFETLKAHLTPSVQEKPLPAVNLNKKQTFYVQTAQMFCELRSKPSSKPETKYWLPPKSRVNGAVSNMEDFSTIFNCPAGAPMNLQSRCNFFN